MTAIKPIRVLLIDDERVGRTRLRHLLEREPDIEIVGECGDGVAGLEAIHEQHPDLLFLDINMPGMNGFELLDKLGAEDQPIVIFVTAFEKHAVRAFDACALDYLLKPVSPDRLARSLSRARACLAVSVPVEVSAGFAPTGRDIPGVPRFVVRSGGRVTFVSADEIDWVEAAGNYAIIHVGKQNHMIRETMAGLEAQLPPEHFIRVSRSAIVNLHQVKELRESRGAGDAAILFDGQEIPMTRSLREVEERLSAL